MRSYQHLTMEERERIRVGKEMGWTLRTIAADIGRSPSTISRELKRNGNKPSNPVAYSAYGAYSRYRHRRRNSHRKPEWGKQTAFLEALASGLKRHWSPQAIVGRYRLEHPEERTPSYQSIYNGIRKGHLPRDYRFYLHRKGRPRNAYRTLGNGKLRVERDIHQRPTVANARRRLGDWESDSLLGKRGRGPCLATHVDRLSRYLVVAYLPKQTAAIYMDRSIAAFESIPDLPLHTMTVDRGMEFSCYRALEAHFQEKGLQVYFADPKAPWQRGTNENTNGLLRQYFPKGCDFSKVTPEELHTAVHALNHRPRKVLGWLSPHEVFFQLGVALV